jgi:hypothetical protein
VQQQLSRNRDKDVDEILGKHEGKEGEKEKTDSAVEMDVEGSEVRERGRGRRDPALHLPLSLSPLRSLSIGADRSHPPTDQPTHTRTHLRPPSAIPPFPSHSPNPTSPFSLFSLFLSAWQEDRAALQAALAMSMAESADAAVAPEPVGPGLPLDFTGNYELFGVVTHKVRKEGDVKGRREGRKEGSPCYAWLGWFVGRCG